MTVALPWGPYHLVGETGNPIKPHTIQGRMFPEQARAPFSRGAIILIGKNRQIDLSRSAGLMQGCCWWVAGMLLVWPSKHMS